MTITRQIRIQTGILDALKERARHEGTSTNAIIQDCLRRGLITYEFVPYKTIKTTLELRLLCKRMAYLTDFLIEALHEMNDNFVEDTSPVEREKGRLFYDSNEHQKYLEYELNEFDNMG